MRLKEDTKQRRIRCQRGVVDHQHHFIVAGQSRTHLLVGGIGRVTCGVPYSTCVNAFQRPETSFCTPETAQSEQGGSIVGRKRWFDRAAMHEMLVWQRDRLVPAREGFTVGGQFQFSLQ